MDLCHLKNSELEPQYQKYKSRVVLRGGSYATFTEQGTSASQMTAAKVMDIISRLPGCAAQAADAVSAYAKVKMEDAPSFLEIPKSECPDIWIRLPKHKWPKSWSSMESPVIPLERNLYGHPLAGVLWERQCENVLLKYGWEKSSKLGMLSWQYLDMNQIWDTHHSSSVTQDATCKEYTCRAHVFLMHRLSACSSQLVVEVVHSFCHYLHALTPRTRLAQGITEHIVSVLLQNSHAFSRNVICYTSLDYTEHGHSFLIFDTAFLTCPISTSQRA